MQGRLPYLCTVSGSGCSVEITAPDSEGKYQIVATIDMNADGDTTDPGEATSENLVVAKPPCPYSCLSVEECGYRSGSAETTYSCPEGKICCKTVLEASHSPVTPTTSDIVTIKITTTSTMSTIDIFVDNLWRRSCSSTNECSYSSQFTEGTHTYEAKASFGSKWYSSGIKSFTVQVAKDNPPLIAITKPIGKTTLPITLKFMVYDKESGVDKGSLAYRLDSGSWISIPSSSCTGSCEKVWPYSCTCEVPIEAKSGQHTLEVRAKDTAGNEGTGSTIFTVEYPSCSGSISLNLPASVRPGSKVTAQVSGLSNCYEKAAYVVSRETQQSVCSCTVSGSGCSCEFTAPNVEGKYNYYAMVDINGNGNYEDPGDISSDVTLTVTQRCTDTDGGNNPLIKGVTEDAYTQGSDSCGTDGFKLVEWFCDKTGLASNTVIDCKIYCQSLGYSSGSCSDGACKCTGGGTTTTTTTTTITSTTTTLPSYTPCAANYFCTASNLACSEACKQQNMVYDVVYREAPCDSENHHYCCKCVVPPSKPCTSHADCSQACTNKCPALVYGCCYGCKLGQCVNGQCQCVDATDYCSGSPAYQVGDKCTKTPTGGIFGNLWDLIKSLLGIQ